MGIYIYSNSKCSLRRVNEGRYRLCEMSFWGVTCDFVRPTGLEFPCCLHDGW